MIMKLAKRVLGQSNSTYAKSLLEYISTATILAESVSGHTQEMVEKCVYFNVHGCLTTSIQSQEKEFGMCADGANKCAENVLRHYVISWPKGVKITGEKAEKSAQIFLEGLGYDTKTAQFAVGLHVNTDNNHIHILANRQNPETGKLVREGGGWWVREGLKALAKIEYTFNWKPEKHSLYKWNPDTQTAEKIRKPKSKDDRVSDRARRMELESGVKSQERIIKELCVQIRDMIAAIPIEKRSWADTHRAFAAVGILYERAENKQGATVTLDGKTFRAASSVADDFSLKMMEKLIGSTYRSPPKKEAEAMKQAMDEARKKIFATPVPLPKRLFSVKSKAKYLQEWERGRFQNRLREEQFRNRARQHNLQKKQQEMGHAPR